MIIFNMLASLIYAVIIGIISSITNKGFSMEILHMSLLDFFILQIFLLIFELYIKSSSKEIKLVKKSKYLNFFKGIIDYERRNVTNEVTEKLVLLSMDKCLEYCRLDTNQNILVSVVEMREVRNMLISSSNERKWFCGHEQFQISDLDDFELIILFYDSYSELFQLYKQFENRLLDDRLLFYRRHEEIRFKSYFLFDEKYAIVEDKEGCYWIYSDPNVVDAYIKDFISNQKKSVQFGRTQNQDSLFLNQSIKEFYGDGNVPEIHLGKIGNVGKNILDLGTGAGRLLSYFTDSSKYEVIAMDKDETALNECKKNYGIYPHIKFIWEEFNENSFQSNQFDLIIAFNSLYHTDRASISKVISRVKYILKPGGYFLLTLKTLEGNEKVYQHAGELFPKEPENTFINTEFPDYYLPHHFCNKEEIDIYLGKFSKVIYKEEIPFKEHNGDIVQGRGFFYILQK